MAKSNPVSVSVPAAAPKAERKYLPTNRVIAVKVVGLTQRVSKNERPYVTLTVANDEGTTANGLYLSLAGTTPDIGDTVNVVIVLNQYQGKWSTTVIGQ